MIIAKASENSRKRREVVIRLTRACGESTVCDIALHLRKNVASQKFSWHQLDHRDDEWDDEWREIMKKFIWNFRGSNEDCDNEPPSRFINIRIMEWLEGAILLKTSRPRGSAPAVKEITTIFSNFSSIFAKIAATYFLFGIASPEPPTVAFS